MVCAQLMHKKNTSKDCDIRDNDDNNNKNNNNNNKETLKNILKNAKFFEEFEKN